MNWNSMQTLIRDRALMERLREADLVTGPAYDRAIELMKPSLDWRKGLDLFLLGLGVLQLLAGVIFFFAYNWADMGRFFKLGLIEIALLVCVAAAWRKGVETMTGRVLLFAASTLTGVLFAVFGQIYQTGADAWQLFANWAALSLVWVLVARSRLLWIQWLVVFTTAFNLWWYQAAPGDSDWKMVTAPLIMAVFYGAVSFWSGHESRGRVLKLGLADLAPWLWAAMLIWLIYPNGVLILVDMKQFSESDTLSLFLAALVAAAAITWSFIRDRTPQQFPRLCMSIYYLMYLVLSLIARILFVEGNPEEATLVLYGVLVIGALSSVTWWLKRQKRLGGKA